LVLINASNFVINNCYKYQNASQNIYTDLQNGVCPTDKGYTS